MIGEPALQNIGCILRQVAPPLPAKRVLVDADVVVETDLAVVRLVTWIS